MELKEQICKAFCEDISVRSVPVGLAVSTAFSGHDGDPIGFYVIGPDHKGNFRLEDDGMTVPLLEANGADLDNKSRHEVFSALLQAYQVHFDEKTFELKTGSVTSEKVAEAALRFVNLILRVQDILYMAQERAASTFREDVLKQLHKVVREDVEIIENAPISPGLEDYPADIVLKAMNTIPLAVYLCNTDQKILEALVLHYASRYEKKIQCSVAGILETGKSVSSKNLQRAMNHLDAVTQFRGDEAQAIRRVTQNFSGGVIH